MIVIVDTGCANLTSVRFALNRLGVEPVISADQSTIAAAEKVLLPGVGHAGFAMEQLEQKGLIEPIKALEQPVLGICLGMQLLLEGSQEGDTDCLGVIPGQVPPLDTKYLISPHMGWNTLVSVKGGGLLNGLEVGDYFYFVHSFAADLSNYTIAECEYGSRFSAAINKDNFYGVQFHPERSGAKGLQVLRNFLEVKA